MADVARPRSTGRALSTFDTYNESLANEMSGWWDSRQPRPTARRDNVNKNNPVNSNPAIASEAAMRRKVGCG